jgi:outer membrane protein OmpA-like peptidoglycan-associated protein
MLTLTGTLLVLSIIANAQLRPNLNNWFLAGNVGTTFGHTDVRPAFDSYFNNPGEHFGWSVAPEVSYHFTHGFGLVGSLTWANIRSNEFSKNINWKPREYNTNLFEYKFMGHLNLGRALSFNKRRNFVSPYVNMGVGQTFGKFNAPLSNYGGTEYVRQALAADGHDTTGFETWNKNLQVGFYFYINRYIDFDIRYNYTFYNEDYIDGSWPLVIGNREWDKYSSISMGVRIKFGANNRRTYEHTSWARELMEEDTSLFNTYVEIEEFDDGTGSPVFKVRTRPNVVNEEELTKIETDNSSDDDMYNAVYNTLMENPDLRDSLLSALEKDLQDNDKFVSNVKEGICVECPQTDGNGNVIIDKDEIKEEILKELVRDIATNKAFITKVREGVCVDCTGERVVVREVTKEDDPESGVGNVNRTKDPVNPITKLDEFELRDIYYDLDEAFIRNDASSSLDELANLLKKYPNLKIELGSHTDCRNSKNYNLGLSQRRALAAVNYLECQGIDRCRLVAKAYGESQLVNKCDCEGEDKGEDCTEEEHQRNRRTTVKILSYDYKPGSGDCQRGVDVDAAAQKDASENSIDIEYGKPKDLNISDSDVSAAGISMKPAAGYYIVIGTSYHPKYAAALAALAKDKEDFTEADVLYLNNEKYFVYADSSDSYEDALAKLKAVRCCTRFPDAWIYGYNKEIPTRKKE